MSSALIGVFPGMILSGRRYVAPEFPRKIATRSLGATETGQIMCVFALCLVPMNPPSLVVTKP
jgi:DHA2 family multidrug resistance protein